MDKTCVKCNSMGTNKIAGKWYCKEHYYEELGKITDEFPLGSPFAHNGTLKRQVSRQ
jgi:hypothetical protein